MTGKTHIEIKREINDLENLILSNNEELVDLNKPYDTVDSLKSEINDKKQRIESTEDERIKKRLELQIESLDKKIKSILQSITDETKKRIEEIETQNEESMASIKRLQKLLEQTLLRNTQTIVSVRDISQFFGGTSNVGAVADNEAPKLDTKGGTLSLIINSGQEVEYLISEDSGNIYMKISKLSSFEGFKGSKTKVDYTNVLVQEENKRAIDVVEVIEEDNGISTGSNTTYISNIMNYQTSVNVSTSLGFVVIDIDREDGDLSVWGLISSNS